MADTRTGVKIVAAEIGAAIDRERASEGEQLELLPPTRFVEGSAEHGELVEAVKRSYKGRPPGATGIHQRDMVKFCRRTYGDPFVESARWAMHTPASLARELKCTELEAFDRLERIRADLRRFMYAPLAPVDGTGQAVAPTFHMVIGGQAAGADGRPPWLYEGGPVLEEQPSGDPGPNGAGNGSGGGAL